MRYAHGRTHSVLATTVIFTENRGSENGTLENKIGELGGSVIQCHVKKTKEYIYV